MTSMRKLLTIARLIAAVCVISLPAGANPIVTESTSNSTVKTETDTTTTVKSAPPSAISPSISGSNSDLCTVGSVVQYKPKSWVFPLVRLTEMPIVKD